ncbi:MAG TPA: hypothetical protein PLP83_05485 [Candidatus Aminicenantes bacterium]|nr:hypothetical protein [Candidatus Aminicenantes bacterium]
MVQLKLDVYDAEAWIHSVQNNRFQEAIEGNWFVDGQGRVKAQSVLWIYCWAVTGMGSIDTARDVQEVFDRIFPFTYNFFKSKVDHEWAREKRYAACDIEIALAALLEAK